jgi:hypothetical protein
LPSVLVEHSDVSKQRNAILRMQKKSRGWLHARGAGLEG